MLASRIHQSDFCSTPTGFSIKLYFTRIEKNAMNKMTMFDFFVAMISVSSIFHGPFSFSLDEKYNVQG
jgi:hypothetical protein